MKAPFAPNDQVKKPAEEMDEANTFAAKLALKRVGKKGSRRSGKSMKKQARALSSY